ncbi:MAG: DNA-packaging protein [Proteobacteria bacterium]|nr:DNA-packaging protein [Pseudomonadota bacterium]
MRPKTREAILSLLVADDAHAVRLNYDWQFNARDDQLPPRHAANCKPWRTWLLLGGRGSGKTRAGAEWVRAVALGLWPGEARASRIALVGPTQAHVRSVMIEGVSGLMSVHPPRERPTLEISKNQLVWPNGAIAQFYSAEDPEGLRGPQFDAAWCDELGRWKRGHRAWDMLQFGLRLGTFPRQVVTTTPRATKLLQSIIADEATAVTRARTTDNAANLAPAFIAEVTRMYAGTALGKQELDGEVVTERADSLWQRKWLVETRLRQPPELSRIVVAVDPPVTATENADTCGIVVAGLWPDNRAYVLADRSLQGRDPITWARAVIAAFRDFSADRIVAEANQGGDLVVNIIHQVDANAPVKKVHATRGKFTRAEPVAALYAEGRVVHVGEFPALENQMCDFGPDGISEGRSPDRVDALVWALTELMFSTTRAPVIRRL